MSLALLTLSTVSLAKLLLSQHMSQVTLSIDDVVVTSNIAKSIRNKRHGDQLKEYIIRKEKKQDPGWSDLEFDSIDWASFHVAVKKEKPGACSSFMDLGPGISKPRSSRAGGDFGAISLRGQL